MSTNNECLFFQWEKDQWYYALENYNAPKNSWDWREYAQAYGPFHSQEIANEHLFQNHANPGGSSHQYNPDKTDPVLIELVKKSFAPRRIKR